MNKTMNLAVALLLSCSAVQAAEWKYAWKIPSAQPALSATVCPFLYGKNWGYAFEIDDGPVEVRTFTAGFFAGYQWNDAPPGVSGGRDHPIVGSVAVIGCAVGANSTLLSWDQIKELLDMGWGVANHSYYHLGHTWGDPPRLLSREELREDLFWSQAMIGRKTGLGRAPTHMVYPNGYPAYSDYFEEFGLRSGSLVCGPGGRNFSDPKFDLKMIDRTFMDEGNWNTWMKSEPMAGFPEDGGPVPNDQLILDFTHSISSDPQTPNYQRWQKRMETIVSRYGKTGSNDFWNAPAEQIINYKLAADKAEIHVDGNGITVRLPDDIPGSALTLQINNVPPNAVLAPPEGGVLYQKGSTVWLTTPVIGKPGSPLPDPSIKCIFKGPAGEYAFEKPEKLAGVLVKHFGQGEELLVKAEVEGPDGKTETMATYTLPNAWANGTILLPALPNKPAPLVKKVTVTQDKRINEMEVWVVE